MGQSGLGDQHLKPNRNRENLQKLDIYFVKKNNFFDKFLTKRLDGGSSTAVDWPNVECGDVPLMSFPLSVLTENKKILDFGCCSSITPQTSLTDTKCYTGLMGRTRH